jgi:hypothetical protein
MATARDQWRPSRGVKRYNKERMLTQQVAADQGAKSPLPAGLVLAVEPGQVRVVGGKVLVVIDAAAAVG